MVKFQAWNPLFLPLQYLAARTIYRDASSAYRGTNGTGIGGHQPAVFFAVLYFFIGVSLTFPVSISDLSRADWLNLFGILIGQHLGLVRAEEGAADARDGASTQG